MAPDEQLAAAALLLQVRHFLDDIAANNGGVGPVRVLQCGGERIWAWR